MAVLHTFFQIYCSPNGLYYLHQAVTPDPASLNLKKCAKWPLLSAEGWMNKKG
jgi:hypothetical protein